MKRKTYQHIYRVISTSVIAAMLAGIISAATPVTAHATSTQPEELVSVNAIDVTEAQAEETINVDTDAQSVEPVREEITRALTYHDADDPVPVMSATDSTVYANRGTIPSAYNSVTEGKVSSLKNQGSYGTCWAFAAVGASEASLISQGKATTDIDLSERHLAYFFYNKGETGDVLGGTTGDYNTGLTDTYMNQGGNSLFTMWHLASWAGLVEESVAPYEGIATALTSNTANVYGSSAYHLQNAYIINKTNTDVVKQAIMDYGSVAMAYHAVQGASNYDKPIAGDYGAYYYNVANAATNHAVQIVGWDDNYSAGNFTLTPEGNGAWLVKNSWGEERENETCAQDGYFWISYYDTGLSANFYAFICEPADNYNNIYQYDGAAGNYYYAAYSAANVFEVQANNGRPEILQAVGIGNYSNGVDYTLTIYKGLSDGNDPTSGTKMLEQTGTLTYSGYNTVKLNNPIMVSPGEKFSVVWTFDSSTALYVDYEYVNGNWLQMTTEEKAQTSFGKTSSYSTYWSDMDSTYNPMTFRIKAYTDNAPENVEYPLEGISLSKTSATLEPGGLVNLTVTYDPLYTTDDTTITWSSSNEAVATVTNGVVRAQGAGTAVITATCGTKTATCKITVKEQKFAIQNKNNTAGTFTIRVARVNELSNVSGVKVAVWSNTGGQDDLKWYTATHQGNGVYTVNVNIANHKTSVGAYSCHAYVNYKNGTSKFYASGSTTFTKEYASSTGITATVASNENTATLNLTGVVGASNVKFAVWSTNKGQDDLKWYTARNQGNGTWSVSIPLSNHKYMAGSYQVHAYAGNAYTASKYMRATTFNMSSPKVGSVTTSNVNNGAGTFKVTVGGITAKAGVKQVRVAIWSKSNQSNLKWYTATKQSNGTYVVNVNLANHGYEYGTYQCHAYLYDTNGIQAFNATKVTINQPKAVLTATGNGAGTQYTLKASNVGYAGGVKAVKVAVWSNTGGQNDLAWYQLKSAGNGNWTGNVPISKHKTAGTYQAHMYVVDKNGKSHFAGSTTFVVSVPTIGTMTTSNVNPGAGTFRVTVGGINAKAGVQQVRVAIWSKSNQSNLKWYTATKQSNGTYVVNANLANHGYEYGTYQCHAYLYDNNGIQAFKATNVQLIQPKAVLTATGNSAGTQYTIKASNVAYAGGVKGVKVAVWSNVGGQDDLRWYSMANSNGVWTANVLKTQHKGTGVYQAHIYLMDRNGRNRMLGGTTFTVK